MTSEVFVDFGKMMGQNQRVRWWLIFVLLLGLSARGAEPAEMEAFAAAAKASQDRFFERAEKSWSEFLGRFPNSERANEAALALAQARHQLKQFASALQILDERLPKAGGLTDQYQFWRGQTRLDMTNYAGAEEAFAELIRTHTNSPLRLDAAVGQGLARFRREDFGGVVELLGGTNSVFQEAARASTNAAVVARGFLTLAESQLRRNDLAGARASLQGLAGRALDPEIGWERWMLLARVESAGPAPEQALSALTNAVERAKAAKRPGLVGTALNLEAEVFRRLNQLERASRSYEGIISGEGMPAEQRRLALLKQTELAAAQGGLTNAVGRINLFLTQNPQDAIADQLNIKAGELLLEAYRAQTNKLVGPGTNQIAEAVGFFDRTIQQFTNSPLLGRAWLGRGWALWEEHQTTGNPQRLVDSQAAFQIAAEKLPAGDEKAQARLKFGETLFKQNLFAAAATNFEAVVTAPNVRTNLVAHAVDQLVRAQMAQTNLAGAEAALQRAVALLPGEPQVQQSWLNLALACAEMGELEKSRGLLTKFSASFTNSPLRSDAELAHARTFALEGKWQEALDLYSKWTAANPAHPSLPRAELDRVRLSLQAGQETNAFLLLTNFVARFPTNELAAQAQFQIADYYFNREQWSQAEQNYQRVFLSTNWHLPELACRARLAAAKSAFLRQNYADARGYLTNLLNVACSQEIVAESYFMLGDVLVEERLPSGSTNLLGENFRQALNAFERVTRSTNQFEPAAWGRIGDCYFQLAVVSPEVGYQMSTYQMATNAYGKLLNSPRADVPVRDRNLAEIQIGTCLEKMAALTTASKERAALQQEALNHYLNIVYGKPRQPDPVRQREAALKAGRLAEAVDREAASKLYERLMNEIPSMKGTWKGRLDALPPSD